MVLLYILLGLLGAIVLIFLFLIGCALTIDPKKEYPEHSRFYRRMLNICTAVGLWGAKVRIHIQGAEKLPEDTKRILFVSNHRSNFDPIVTWMALKKYDMAFVSKPENFRIPIFGRVIRRCCFLPIDREDPRKAMETIFRAANLLEGGQVSVGIYPEGTRSKDCTLLPFHNGVFKIAQRSQASVAVLTVTGTENIHKNWLIRRTDVYIRVAEVIPPEAVAAARTGELGEKVRQIMEEDLPNKKER